MGFPQLTKRGKTKLVLKEERLKSNLEGPDHKGDRNAVSDALEWMECRVRCTRHHKSQVMARGLIKMAAESQERVERRGVSWHKAKGLGLWVVSFWPIFLGLWTHSNLCPRNLPNNHHNQFTRFLGYYLSPLNCHSHEDSLFFLTLALLRFSNSVQSRAGDSILAGCLAFLLNFKIPSPRSPSGQEVPGPSAGPSWIRSVSVVPQLEVRGSGWTLVLSP